MFSRNRACQLDALLSGLGEKFAPIHVLYRATTTRFAQGYDACIDQHRSIVFHGESNFRSDVLALLPDDGLICFFTDDDLVFREIVVDRIVTALADTSIVAFSLRLGANTTHCFSHDCEQTLPVFERRGGYLVWRWSESDWDFGYPLSLDGHIVRSDDIKSLLVRGSFDNPNELEELLAASAESLGRPILASFESSALVGVPANRVNETHENRHGNDPNAAVDQLNERFLRGWHIDAKAMSFDNVYGAHALVVYAFSRLQTGSEAPVVPGACF